jgi:hypothetical protein
MSVCCCCWCCWGWCLQRSSGDTSLCCCFYGVSLTTLPPKRSVHFSFFSYLK